MTQTKEFEKDPPCPFCHEGKHVVYMKLKKQDEATATFECPACYYVVNYKKQLTT